jgi:hypothetical protein
MWIIGMARILPSLWLLGAALYTAGTLVLVQPFHSELEPGSLIIPINETIKAKQPPADDARAALPPLPRPELGRLRTGQWVQVVGYTAVVRAVPAMSGHVLAGYPVGQPFRVLVQDGDFVRVQDLRSGQLGWIRKASLGPYTDGYRQRRVVMTPQLAAAPQVTAPQVVAQRVVAAVPETPAASVWRGPKPFALGPAPGPSESSIDTAKRDRALRVSQDDSLASIMQRAFSGAH